MKNPDRPPSQVSRADAAAQSAQPATFEEGLAHLAELVGSRMAYKLVALDTFSTDPKLQALLANFGRGGMPQKVAQAATWHVANGLTWDQLAAKKIDRLGRPDDAWFTQAELLLAHRSVAMAVEQAAKDPAATAVPSASQRLGR